MDQSKMETLLLYLFGQARMIHQSASRFSASQDGIRMGCHALEMCEEMIRKLGLFPPSATKDDIITTNLEYILVPYYFGELTEKRSEVNRIEVIKASQVKLKEFISFCESMELVTQEELDLSVQGGMNAPADQRARKACLTKISLAFCKAFDLLKMLKKEEDLLSVMAQLQDQNAMVVTFSSNMEGMNKKVKALSRNVQLLNWVGGIIGFVLTGSLGIISYSVWDVKKDFSSTLRTASSQMKKLPPEAMSRAEKVVVSTTEKVSKDGIMGLHLVVSKVEGIASAVGRDFKIGAGLLGFFIAIGAGIMRVSKSPKP